MSETLTQVETANHDILTLTAASLSAAPDLTDAERATRFQTVVRGAMAFRPADPAQAMLASLILGHHMTIMDGFRDIARTTLTPAEAARARMVTVAQTKLLLQLVRELRIARAEATTQPVTDQPLAEAGAPEQGQAGDAAQEASLARFMSACSATLASLQSTDSLTPAAAARARDALSQAMPPALFAMPREAEREATPLATPVTTSRAQRRALMRKQGAFKRTA